MFMFIVSSEFVVMIIFISPASLAMTHARVRDFVEMEFGTRTFGMLGVLSEIGRNLRHLIVVLREGKTKFECI